MITDFLHFFLTESIWYKDNIACCLIGEDENDEIPVLDLDNEKNNNPPDSARSTLQR